MCSKKKITWIQIMSGSESEPEFCFFRNCKKKRILEQREREAPKKESQKRKCRKWGF